MQGIPVLAKLEKLESVEKLEHVSPRKITLPSAGDSKKATFAELVERAHNEMLEKQKVDKNQKAEEQRVESPKNEKSRDAEAARASKTSDEKRESETQQTKARSSQNEGAREAPAVDAVETSVAQIVSYHDEAQNALFENIALVIEGAEGSGEIAAAQHEPAIEGAAIMQSSFAALQLSEQPVQENADARLVEDEHRKDSFAERQFALDADGKITVTDLRTEVAPEAVKPVKNAETELLISTDKNSSPEFVMTLGQNVQHNILSLDNQSASAASSNFQAMLTNQIQANAGEFVKAGSIVLRDNNMGTINLVLRPESLGNVKISLQLSDKVINGQIVVSTQEAYNAFKDSADILRNAFSQNGFDANAFTVAYSGAQSGGGNFAGTRMRRAAAGMKTRSCSKRYRAGAHTSLRNTR